MIKVDKVVKHFDKFKVLDEISINVPRGAIYGLVGPNGAGKTTIINHISGAYRPESGSITIDGKEVYENPSVKEKVLFIADDWFFYPTFTIKQMAKLYADMYPSFDRERYEKIKGVFNIDDKRQIRKLSKGMKKQVAFWLSLSCMPEVLILDEPLDGLDPVMRKQVLSLVIADVADREMTVLVSSHNLRELEDICDYVGIIHKGRMILEKPLDDLKGNVHKYQVVFGENKPEDLDKSDNVLHISNTGSVYNIIMKGSDFECDNIISRYNPSVCDKISLTLEEVFVYELGGLGYDYKSIL